MESVLKCQTIAECFTLKILLQPSELNASGSQTFCSNSSSTWGLNKVEMLLEERIRCIIIITVIWNGQYKG